MIMELPIMTHVPMMGKCQKYFIYVFFIQTKVFIIRFKCVNLCNPMFSGDIFYNVLFVSSSVFSDERILMTVCLIFAFFLDFHFFF